jgi:hypothetical protein
MTHEPHVSRELFGRVEGRARENENQSRAGVQPNAPANAFVRAVIPLRGPVVQLGGRSQVEVRLP